MCVFQRTVSEIVHQIGVDRRVIKKVHLLSFGKYTTNEKLMAHSPT